MLQCNSLQSILQRYDTSVSAAVACFNLAMIFLCVPMKTFTKEPSFYQNYFPDVFIYRDNENLGLPLI